MNAFQTCTNLSDALPLYLPQQLYIKPIARMNISIQLPNVKKLGKSISHWEIMEKLRQLIKPDEFTILKVTKTTLEFVRFEAEVEVKSKLERTISKLDNKTIKLKDFTEMMRVKAAKSKSDFPSRRTWDMFFQDAKDMDDLKPGERPDTIYLSNIPIKWFVPYHLSETEDVTPSEKILYRVFEKFGNIRFVDIPICDPYRKKMKEQISGLKRVNSEFFEGYVQFKDYIGFSKAMDALRDMKLVHKEEDGEAVAVDIKVDFDRTKHLSDASMRRREIVRDRLVRKAKAKEEEDKKAIEEKKQKEQLERQKEIDIKTQKELRRRLREEKRKAKILEKLEVNGSDEMNEKIAREEKKLLKVQRKLEAIRLVEELFRRVHEKKSEENGNLSTLGLDEIKKFKNTSELEVLNQREKLHNAIKGRVMLKTVLSDKRERKNSSTSSSSGEEENKKQEDIFTNPALLANSGLYDASWFGFPYHSFFPIRGMFNPRAARGGLRHFPGPSRGGPPYMRRSRGGYRGGYRGGRKQSYYPPEVEEEYRKYFEKFLHDSRSRSRSRSRRRSSSRRRRSYSRSYSRSRSRSRSKSYKSRTRSRRSYSNSRSRSRSRSRSVDSSKFMTPKQLRAQQSRSSSERRRRRSSTRTPERKS